MNQWKSIQVVPVYKDGNSGWGWQVSDGNDDDVNDDCLDLIYPPMQNFGDACIFAEDFAIRHNVKVLPPIVD